MKEKPETWIHWRNREWKNLLARGTQCIIVKIMALKDLYE